MPPLGTSPATSAQSKVPGSSDLSEGPGFSPVIAPPPETRASVPEGLAARTAGPAIKIQPHHIPALAQPNATTNPNPTTGVDAHLPPIDSYELDARNAADSNEPPPPSPDPEAQPAPASSSDASTLQAAAVEALFAAGSQNSAAEQLEETTWTVENGEVRIQTSLSKPLMNTIFRADTQSIIRGAIANRGGAGLKLTFLSGSVADKPKAAKKPRTGSAQAKALEHPTVQAAQRLFNAEITNVFDLRKD